MHLKNALKLISKGKSNLVIHYWFTFRLNGGINGASTIYKIFKSTLATDVCSKTQFYWFIDRFIYSSLEKQYHIRIQMNSVAITFE